MDDPPAKPSEDVLAARRPLTDLIDQNRFREALAYCEAARASPPLDPWVVTMQGLVCLKIGLSEEASNLALEAINLGSDDPMTALVLGMAQRDRGLHLLAAAALLTAHRLMPDRADAASLAIEAAAAAHGLDAARPVFDEVFERLPDRGVLMTWAKLLFEAGRDDEMPPGVLSAPVMSVPAWAAQTGLAMAFVGDREAIPVEEPPIFGEPSKDRFKAMVPGYVTYACTLRDATIFAKSSLVLMPDGVALNDTVADERFGRFIDLPHDKLVLGRRGQHRLLDVGNYRMEEIEAGVMLSGWASEHFGHWVPEYLCRLAYMERHPRFADLPIIVDSDMPPQHLEYLKLIVPNQLVQIPAGGALRCGELVVAAPSTFFPVHLTADQDIPQENLGGLSIEGVRLIRERVLQRMPAPAARGRKLYLSRKSRTWRLLLNEDEISQAMADRGFEVLFPEEMSFEEQVRMYQSAKIVVAPNGSSLLNAIFASKDLTLIALSQRGLFNWGTFYGLMREIGYDLAFLCNEAETGEKHSSYAIPLPSLIAALETFSA